LLLFGVWYEAEELQQLLARVFELVLLVWRNKDNIACFELGSFFSVKNASFSVKYEDFMFPGVLMQRTATARFHFEKSHGKVFSPNLLSDEPSYFQFLSALIGVFCHNSVVMEYFHTFFTSTFCLIRWLTISGLVF